MKAKLKFKENGECVACMIDTKDPGFQELDVETLSVEDNHKQPFLTEHRLSKIKIKTKEILLKHNYIFGLSIGWKKDYEYKKWCEEVISFSNSFEGRTIEDNQVTFPMDPWGYQEVLRL